MKCICESTQNEISSITCYLKQEETPPNAKEFLAIEGDSIYSKQLLFDLSHLEYISSEAISWLLHCQRQTSERGSKLVLHSLTEFVKKTMSLMKLEDVFDIASTHEEGMQLLLQNSNSSV